jgi:hypothetical protein
MKTDGRTACARMRRRAARVQQKQPEETTTTSEKQWWAGISPQVECAEFRYSGACQPRSSRHHAIRHRRCSSQTQNEVQNTENSMKTRPPTGIARKICCRGPFVQYRRGDTRSRGARPEDTRQQVTHATPDRFQAQRHAAGVGSAPGKAQRQAGV